MCYDRLIESFGRRLPKRDEWVVADDDGWTIAHHFASRKVLPLEFDHWTLADEAGTTVAHAAAANGMLPKGFNLWLLKDGKGSTVAHTAVKSGMFDIHNFSKEVLSEKNADGETVWDCIRKADNPRFQSLKAQITGSTR